MMGVRLNICRASSSGSLLIRSPKNVHASTTAKMNRNVNTEPNTLRRLCFSSSSASVNG